MCGVLFMAVGSELKKIWSAIGSSAAQITPPGAGIGFTGAKKCLVVFVEVWEGWGEQKKELSQSRESNPGIVDGND